MFHRRAVVTGGCEGEHLPHFNNNVFQRNDGPGVSLHPSLLITAHRLPEHSKRSILMNESLSMMQRSLSPRFSSQSRSAETAKSNSQVSEAHTYHTFIFAYTSQALYCNCPQCPRVITATLEISN